MRQALVCGLLTALRQPITAPAGGHAPASWYRLLRRPAVVNHIRRRASLIRIQCSSKCCSREPDSQAAAPTLAEGVILWSSICRAVRVALQLVTLTCCGRRRSVWTLRYSSRVASSPHICSYSHLVNYKCLAGGTVNGSGSTLTVLLARPRRVTSLRHWVHSLPRGTVRPRYGTAFQISKISLRPILVSSA